MDETCCPLCLEEFDPTDLLLAPRLCQCRFAVCLWCFRRLTEDAAKEGRQALCPKCRGPYDTERIAREGRELNPEQYAPFLFQNWTELRAARPEHFCAFNSRSYMSDHCQLLITYNLNKAP